ncbi:MAG TPA: hemerythrin domain-containing protein [Nocardioidaceae bacterium]|nr:hemerythrin domain-containing protein [Nocardioidaceae bacterium]
MADVIPKPTHGDVVELILDDHRLFEELLRQVRDTTQDRDGLRQTLARALVAHEEAEEKEVYPSLRNRAAIDTGEVEHSEHEHEESNEALLQLLEVDDVSSEEFSNAVHELSEALSHHLDEEERDVLNPARTDVTDDAREQLGAAFAAERAAQLNTDCGSIDNVRRLVERAQRRAG